MLSYIYAYCFWTQEDNVLKMDGYVVFTTIVLESAMS